MAIIIKDPNAPEPMLSVYDIQCCLWHSYSKHIILLNAFICDKDQEGDFIYVTFAGYLHEIEIKRSYADFKKDFLKGKHEKIVKGEGMQNTFSYCFGSKDLAYQCLPEVPKQYGVIYATTMFYPVFIREAKQLHNQTISDWKNFAWRMGESYKSKVFSNKINGRPVKDKRSKKNIGEY